MQSINGFNARYSATLEVSQEAVERSGRDVTLAALCGTKTESGKLQVSTYIDGGKGSGDIIWRKKETLVLVMPFVRQSIKSAHSPLLEHSIC